MNILVVDDSRTALVWLKSILDPVGHQTTCVDSGPAALDVLSRADIDLVMTDFAMPGMDGAELLRILRRRYAHLPVVVMSGVSSVDEAVEVLQLGADEFLAKPIRQEELLACLDRVTAKAVLYSEARLFATMVDESPRAPMERLGELLTHYANLHGSPARAFTLEALELLLRWSGSDDEFVKVVESAVLAAKGPIINRNEVVDARARLPQKPVEESASESAEAPAREPAQATLPLFETAMRVVVERFERQYLERLLALSGGFDEALRVSGLDETRLQEMLAHYKLVNENEPRDFLFPP